MCASIKASCRVPQLSFVNYISVNERAGKEKGEGDSSSQPDGFGHTTCDIWGCPGSPSWIFFFIFKDSGLYLKKLESEYKAEEHLSEASPPRSCKSWA